METREKWQEIADRGLQDRFDPDTRAKFDEAVSRGLITMAAERQPPQDPQTLADQLKGYGQDIVSGGTALARGGMGIAAGAAGDIGHFTGLESLEEAGYGAKQRLQEDEQHRRDNTTSMPLRLASEIATGGTAGKGINMGKNFMQKVLTGAGVGGGYGALTPAVSDEEQASQIALGTGVGAGIPATLGAAGAVLKGGRNLIDPLLAGGGKRAAGRIMRDTAGEDRQAIAKLLRENKQLPEGQAAAGEIAAPAGRTEFSALQKISESGDPTAYRRARLADDDSRKALVEAISGKGDDLEQAISARGAQADINYKAAYADDALGRMPPDSELKAIVSNPHYRKEVGDAAESMKARGLTPENDLTQFLHFVKIGLDDKLGKIGDNALSSTKKAEVQALRGDLIDWMGTRNPQYGKARSEFAEASKPINQMEVGKVLRDKLISPLGEEGSEGVQRSAQFAQAVRDAPSTIKKATGFKRFEKLPDVLPADKVEKVEVITESLARRAQYEKMSAEGMKKAKEIIGDEIFMLPSTGPLNQTYMIFKTAFNRLVGKMDERSFKALHGIMRDPQEAARLLEQVPLAERQALQKTLELAQTAGILSAPQTTKAGDF
jgi:hypothetical protein